MRILLLLLLSAFLNQASSSPSNQTKVSFYLASFSLENCNNGSLICSGVVTAYKGHLCLTAEPLPDNSTSPPAAPLDKVGRVLYHQPVLACPASFSTSFSFRISKYPNSFGSGDGLAFIFAPDSSPSPFGSYGSNLGIVSSHLLVCN